MANKLAQAVGASLRMWNTDKNLAWTLGTNYSNVGTEYETYVNKYLFPKLQETKLINIALGNRFNFLAKETPYVAQLNEEYVIMDSVPVDLNLDKSATLLLERNYPRMASKLYGPGVHRKQKFTLNDNDNRLNWQTLADAIAYSIAVYKKKISDINVSEEMEIRAMLVDYSENVVANKRTATDISDLSDQVFETVFNLQNNSAKYNEANTASGGAIGRYTTVSALKDIVILTTDKVKNYLLNTRLANTFQAAGIDILDHVMSFDDLGGSFKTTADVTLTAADVAYINAYGDYQAAVGDVITAGVVFTFDITGAPSFAGKATEIKPASDLYAFVFDVNSIYYKRNTAKLLPTEFYNNELDEYNYFMHYYSFKSISPFFNKVLIEGA